MSAIKLGFLLFAVSCTLLINCFDVDDEIARGLIIPQFSDSYQAILFVRPSRYQPFGAYFNNFEVDPIENSRVKRNNAEVVNHILKNYGAIDRLGDVGR